MACFGFLIDFLTSSSMEHMIQLCYEVIIIRVDTIILLFVVDKAAVSWIIKQ